MHGYVAPCHDRQAGMAQRQLFLSQHVEKDTLLFDRFRSLSHHAMQQWKHSTVVPTIPVLGLNYIIGYDVSNEAPSIHQPETNRICVTNLQTGMHITLWVFGCDGPMYANEGRTTPEPILCDASELFQEPYNDKLSPTSASAGRKSSRNYENRRQGAKREPSKGLIQH